MRINTLILIFSISLLSNIPYSLSKSHPKKHHLQLNHHHITKIDIPQNHKHPNIVKKLSLITQADKPEQSKYYFDEIFSGFNSLEDFQLTFPPQYFAFSSQKFTGNSALINIRNQKNPSQYFESQVNIQFLNPNIKFIFVDEIDPDVFAKKKNNKFNQKILYSRINSFLSTLHKLSQKYPGRINLFITNISPSLFSNYPQYKTFISQLLLLSHHNYLGFIYTENYRGPLSKTLSSTCQTSSNNKQGCLDAINAPINHFQWQSTSKISPKQILSNSRNFLKPLCPQCNINNIVMPTFGLSNINGVCLNNCFKPGFTCRDDLSQISNLVTELKDEQHIAFYGAAHLVDTRQLVIQNGEYYDVEAFYCEIVSAAYPELGGCTETNL